MTREGVRVLDSLMALMLRPDVIGRYLGNVMAVYLFNQNVYEKQRRVE